MIINRELCENTIEEYKNYLILKDYISPINERLEIRMLERYLTAVSKLRQLTIKEILNGYI
jgi:hypothetical protein